MGSLFSRKDALRYSAGVLTVAVLVPVASGIAATTRANAAPATIVGAWSRNVTQANENKYHLGPFEQLEVGVWTMVVKRSGVVDYYTPGLYRPGCIANRTCAPDSSTSFTFAGGRLTIATAPPCGARKGTYAWKVSGSSLRLKVIADNQCVPRQALMTGVWKRTR